MIRAIGAGVGRTGTRSLQKALEHLLKGKCYHMFEVGKKPDDITFWKNVAQGKNQIGALFFLNGVLLSIGRPQPFGRKFQLTSLMLL